MSMKKDLHAISASPEKNEPLSESFFLGKNVIKLFGEVDDNMANYAISALLYLDHSFKASNTPKDQQEVNIWINSPGGSVSAGLAIYDAMNYIDADIRTTCIGMAASMGAFLLSAGTRGKRESLPNSVIMIHQPLGGTQGQASDIVLYTNHIVYTKKWLNRRLSLHTGRPLEQVEVDTDRDNRMTALEALNYGIIDRVIETPVKAGGNILLKEESYA